MKGKNKVLIVDDDPFSMDLLDQELSDLGYDTYQANDGEEALQKVGEADPDLILLDVMMPKLDGYEVCRRLKSKEETRLIPVVMITALKELEDRIKGIEAGADDFLSKPFNTLELQARVKSLLRVKYLNEALRDKNRELESTLKRLQEAQAELKAEKDRLAQELRAAHDMQMGLLPQAGLVVEGIDISGTCLPASEVGGDYFNYIWMNEENTELGIAVADVSGKAMKAAMIATVASGMLQSEVKGWANTRFVPTEDVLSRLNTLLYLVTEKMTFVAFSLAAINFKERILRFSNAGLWEPIVKRGGELFCLKTTGNKLPLGIIEKGTYEESSIELREGDVVVFYTDGVIEATDDSDEMYGNERLERVISNFADVEGRSARSLIDEVLADASKFAGSAEQQDDMTLVVVKVERET